MPRIRSIKPEFCTSEQVAECSPTARLLFVSMWCFCDDAGRHPASVRRLKMECFPGDPFTTEEMTAFVNELHAAGLLVEFEYEGARFWQVTGWHHQKIDKPNAKYGPVAREKRGNSHVQLGADIQPYLVKFGDHSPNARRPVDDASPPEGKGGESTGEEGKGKEGSGFDDQSPTPTATKQSNVQSSPPSVDEVRRYMADREYPDEAEAFVDHYSANGWVQGRGKPIKDWKAAVRNWQRNDFGGSAGAKSPVTYAKQREANMRAAGDRFVSGAPDAEPDEFVLGATS